jgi:hypothetical protein
LIEPAFEQYSLPHRKGPWGGEYAEIATETRKKCWSLDVLEAKEIAQTIEEI